MLHAVRDTLVGQRTQAMNALRGHFGEIGIVVATGPKHVAELVARVMRAAAAANPQPAAPDAPPQEVAKIEEKEEEAALPRFMLTAMQALVSTLANLNADIEELDRAINTALKENELARRLATIPGIGCFIATLLAGLYPSAEGYASARAFAASLGLVPAQHSTGWPSPNCAASRRWATAMSGDCWWWGPPPSSGACAMPSTKPPWASGLASCSKPSLSGW